MTSSHYALRIQDQLGTRLVSLHPSRRWWLLGRSETCQVVVKGQYVSRIHCTLWHLTLELDSNKRIWMVQDGDRVGRPSKNGVYVDQHKIQKQEITVNSSFSLGRDIHITLVLVRQPYPHPPSDPLESPEAGDEETEPAKELCRRY